MTLLLLGTTGRLESVLLALVIALVLTVWLYQFMYESRLRGLLRASPVRIGLAVCMVA